MEREIINPTLEELCDLMCGGQEDEETMPPNRQILCDAGYEESVVFENPDYDSAIVGVTDDGNVIYDFWKMVKCLMDENDMKDTEAIEFIEYNTIRSLPYAGEKAPIIVTMLEDLI